MSNSKAGQSAYQRAPGLAHVNSELYVRARNLSVFRDSLLRISHHHCFVDNCANRIHDMSDQGLVGKLKNAFILPKPAGKTAS
jgi:hypothetical protein